MNLAMLDQKHRGCVAIQIDTDIKASRSPSFCFPRQPRSNVSSVTVGTRRALSLASKHRSSVEGARAAFQVIASGAGAGTTCDEPEAS